jgi:hypothetical protein
MGRSEGVTSGFDLSTPRSKALEASAASEYPGAAPTDGRIVPVTFDLSEAVPISSDGSDRHAQKYSPYAVDWRFLPEEALFAKDFLRYHFVHFSNSMARSALFSRLWVKTFGSRILRSVETTGILFVHIPKTGGTSISKLLYRRNLPHYTAGFWMATFGEAVRSLPSFSVVRHPVERMVSAYKMARSGGTDIMAYSRYWQARLRGLESFDAFVDHVFVNRLRLDALPLDLHSQAAFILDQDGAVMVDKLYSLSNRRGLPRELAHWLAVHPIPHLNATPPYPVNITTEARRKIREIYESDFEIYEYLDTKGGSADIKGHRTKAPPDSPSRTLLDSDEPSLYHAPRDAAGPLAPKPSS